MDLTRTRKSAATAPTLILAACLLAPGCALADENGEPVPGVDKNKTLSEQLDENKGVIEPPPTGDEGIHADVPNPEAGHEEEVIPPPGTPGGDQNIQPK